jgi:hypothetical protein
MKAKLLTVFIVVVVVAFLISPACLIFLVSPPCGELSFVVGNSVSDDFSDVRQDVMEDASNLASELCGNDRQACNRVVGELLTIYSAAEDKDFLLVYNWGGLGRKWGGGEFEELDLEWGTVIEGIIETLEEMGYSVLLVQHTRTYDSLWDYIIEIREAAFFYPTKARSLAAEIDFFTEHIEGLRVILTGNSEGGMFVSEVMGHLEANPRVYSIQCGIPFFYHGSFSERSLVMNDNGITPDALSTGDLWAIIKANLTGPIKYRPEEGHLFFYIRTPGHTYTWDHPGVRPQVLEFLDSNFGNTQAEDF